jgi:mannobiose 2-epimerase
VSTIAISSLAKSASDYANRIEADLRDNVLPFWLKHVPVGKGPRFVGALTNDLQEDVSAERGQLLAARILWTFSAAFRRYRDPKYAKMADVACEELQNYYWDKSHGGYRWSINPDGTPRAERKQIYGQAFAIYALAEYHAGTQRAEPLSRAKQVFELIEQHARDRQFGGYFEAYAADWRPIDDVRLSAIDQNDPKSQNTSLHVMEAYARLLRVWPDPRLRAALADLIEVMITRIVQPNGHLGLFFGREWQLRSDRISFGHDIEAAWLLNDAASAVGDIGLADRVQAATARIADVTLREGVDADGGMYNEAGPEGVSNSNKEWWPQTEALIGFLDAYQHTNEERFLRAAYASWEFIERRLIDRKKGEWFRGVTRDGRLLDREMKVSFWKCPYHNGRSGLEATRRLREIVEES